MLKLVIDRNARDEWPIPHTAALVQEWRDRGGQICAFAYADGRYGWLEWPGLATFSFSADSQEVVAVPSYGAADLTIQDVFRGNALPLILQAFGWEVLHASAVVTPYGVIALCGSVDACSSAVAYSLSRLGHRLCADGALLLDMRGAVKVEALPFISRLGPALWTGDGPLVPDTIFRRPTPLVTEPAERLCAVFLLQRTEEGPGSVKELSAVDAFPLLLEHAYCFNPVDVAGRQRMIANYLSLSRQVGVFQLEVGAGPHHLDDLAHLVVHTVGGLVPVRVTH